MNPVPGVLDRVDRFQRDHRPTAFAWAVNKKYSDDRGGYLAALITYYGFLSIFPLLLAFFTVVAWVVSPTGSTVVSLQRHLGSYPVIGQSVSQLSHHHLHGSVVALLIGVLGLIWGGQGLAQTLQYAMEEVYSVPNRQRPGFVPRLVRGLKWYATFGIGFLASTFVSSLGRIFDWGVAGPYLASLPSLVINVAIFAASFRVLIPVPTTWRRLLPGAIFAGLVWTVLTGVGLGLLKSMTSSSALYGSFGTILGLLAFLYLAARITLYAAEANVVAEKHLWPRALRNPPKTDADRTRLEDLAKQEERVDEQVVEVSFVERPAEPAGADQ